MRNNPSAAFKMADKAPVVVMQRSTPRVVMVNPEQWNTAARRLAYLERILLGDQADARIESGQYDTVEDVEEALAS